MKKFYVLFCILFFSYFAKAQNPDAFIMTINIPPPYLTIEIPILYSDENNFTIDFGDGTILYNQNDIVNHTYSNSGTYTVTITGSFNRIDFNNSFSLTKELLSTIEQWGTNQWKSMEDAFGGCMNLVINAIDAPDLSQVTSLKNMFNDALYFNSPIEHWDVSNITDMSSMFKNAGYFNQPLNNWNVSNVTNMSEMFNRAFMFNQSIENWDVSNVTDMSGMFNDVSYFNQPIDTWDVSSVTNMSFMFYDASNFNQPIDTWDVSSVTNMSFMFNDMYYFDQPLNSWDVSNVTDMSFMFSATDRFNQPLDNWNVSNVTDMSYMFYNAEMFDQSIGNWNVLNVTNMSHMFYNAIMFNQSIENWNVSNVTDMSGMFMFTFLFNQPLNNWNVSNVTNMSQMFKVSESFNQPLENWNVSNVTDMSEMFMHNYIFNQPINGWNVSNVTNMEAMFMYSSFDQPLNDWNVSNVTNMSSMFHYAIIFNQPLDNWNTASNANEMFKNAELFNQNLSSWNWENTYFDGDFVNYSGLDTTNYDKLLLSFAQQNITGRMLYGDGLHYCNSSVIDYLTNELNWIIFGGNFSEECNRNNIAGSIIYDDNNNGCDNNDIRITNLLITASDDEASIYTASSNSQGGYVLKVMDNTYSVSLFNVPDYFTVNPTSTTLSFEGFGAEETLDFCLTSNQSVQDLNITILPISEARPGFEANYQIIVQNIGTQTINNSSISILFDDTKQSFVSAIPSTNTTTSNQLNWNISSLAPFQNQVIDFTMQTFTPPTVNGNDILNFTATVSQIENDYTPNDNTFELAQIVVNSFDPNDKQVLQGNQIDISEVDEYLNFLIRFQNTGTATAIHVRIEDELHESLNWNTIQIVNASHNFRVEIKDGNQMEFIFENIDLPYEDADEEGSNGFIAYKIKPIEGLQVGDIITGNEAYIFFDYNLPIVTNITATEVIEATNSISTSNINNLISIYPNPTNGILNITTKNDLIVQNIKLFNLQGRELKYVIDSNQSINMTDLSSGVYIISIDTNQGNITKRFIKN